MLAKWHGLSNTLQMPHANAAASAAAGEEAMAVFKFWKSSFSIEFDPQPGPLRHRNMALLEGQQPVSVDGKTFEPLEAFGLQTISIGFLVAQDKPLIWRGPMVTQALNQMVFSTNWKELDYLIVDLPPGTVDIQLTLTQKVPVSGAVIVTTPQDIALLDARRGLKMFEKVNVRVLGVIENMSTHVCSSCGHEEALFGTGGGQDRAAETGVPLLGALPLDIRIRREADGGEPTVIADPDSVIGLKYREIARGMAARLAMGPRWRSIRKSARSTRWWWTRCSGGWRNLAR